MRLLQLKSFELSGQRRSAQLSCAAALTSARMALQQQQLLSLHCALLQQWLQCVAAADAAVQAAC
jgi:hypothetical protein